MTAGVPSVQTIELPLVGSAYKGRSSNVNAQECVNWYVELDNNSAKTTKSLHPTPGLVEVDSLGGGAHRGAIKFKGDAYFVVGNELVKMNTSEEFTSVGTLATHNGRVSMASNGVQGDQIVIVDGTYGYVYDGTAGTLTQITFYTTISPDFVVFIDSYFIVNDNGTGQFYRSALNDGSTWPAQFATAERDPDDLISIIVNQRELYLLGERTVEVWYNDGSTFGFTAIPNAFSEWGIAAANSVAKAHGLVFWLSKNNDGEGFFLAASGYQPEIISTRALEYQLSTYNYIDDAEAFVYQQAGHTFYVCNFPKEGKTWVYDVSNKEWHERSSHLRSGEDTRWRPGTHLFFNGKHYVGDYDSGILYYLDLDTYTDAGQVIKRKRVAQHVSSTGERLRHYKLELEFERGIGNTTGQGSDPMIMVSWSDDGGHTWSNKRYVAIGKLGEYSNRAILSHLGSSRDRVYKIEVSDPVKFVLIRGLLTVSVSKH